MKRLHIQRAPIGVSLQDAGRKGYLRYGVSTAGPMDWAHHAMANSILGKPLGDTAIEVGPAGMDLILDAGELQLSFAGPGFVINYAGINYSNPARFMLNAGQLLKIVPRTGAMWGYLGIQGTFDLPLFLGSHAENSVSGLNAIRIASGSSLPVRDNEPVSPSVQNYIDPYIGYEGQTIGILPSSQFDDFPEQMRAKLVSEVLSIAPRFDRMAYQLKGVNLRLEKGHDILSDGVTMGAIQVPGDGRPFVLMADHQPTGGYPKIACICKADLPRLAQLAPGRYFTMQWISLDQGLNRWATVIQQIESMTALRGI